MLIMHGTVKPLSHWMRTFCSTGSTRLSDTLIINTFFRHSLRSAIFVHELG
jgi:hypothetical protein